MVYLAEFSFPLRRALWCLLNEQSSSRKSNSDWFFSYFVGWYPHSVLVHWLMTKIAQQKHIRPQVSMRHISMVTNNHKWINHYNYIENSPRTIRETWEIANDCSVKFIHLYNLYNLYNMVKLFLTIKIIWKV